ncbi:MAG TPA: response regulator [Steroidobacter sp.]|nr:response regulator [Steroidobacter sp.]
MQEQSGSEFSEPDVGACGQVLVIEDHETIVAGLRALSDSVQLTGYELVFASSMRDAAGLLNPRVELLLLDAQLTAAEGGSETSLSALKALQRQVPNVPIGIFSGDDSESAVVRAIAAGAAGFIPKRTPPKLLLAAIDLMRHGGLYVPANLIGTVGGTSDSATPKRRMRATDVTA